MKLKLPLTLLAALFACMNLSSAQDTTTDGSTGDTTTETEPVQTTTPSFDEITVAGDHVTATPENDYTVKITGDYGTSWYVSGTDVTWNQSYDYGYDGAGNARPINVGSALTPSKLSVITPEDAEEQTVVTTKANLFIGCPGWGISASELFPPQTGEVYVGKNAVLDVGSGTTGTSTNQLNVGAGVSSSQYGHEGILVVDGGKAMAGCFNVACGYEDIKGTVIVKNGGEAIAVNRKSGSATGVLTLAYYTGAQGFMTVEGASSVTAEYYTMVGYGRKNDDGSYDEIRTQGVLEVKEKSTATLGSYLFVGREKHSEGTVTVDDSTLTAGTTYLGYTTDSLGSLTFTNSSTAELGTTYVGYNGGNGSLSVASKAEVKITGEAKLGGWSGSVGVLDVASAGTLEIGSTLTLGYASGTMGKATISGAGSKVTAGAEALIGYVGNASLDISDGAELEVKGNFGSALGSASTADTKVSGAGSKLTLQSAAYVGEGGSATLSVEDGASASSMSYLVLGFNSGASGLATIDGEGSSLVTAGPTYVGYYGTGELNVRNGADAVLGGVAVNDESKVNISGSATVSVQGDMGVAQKAKVTVEGSDVTVYGAYSNEGTTTVTLGNGNSFTAGSIENSGTMTVTAQEGSSFTAGSVTVNQGATMNMSVAVGQEAGATFEVGTYTNRGTSSIDAAEGTTCYFGSLVLEDGTMTMTGKGKYVLGNAPNDESEAPSTTFTVFGESAETASTTTIDITELNEQIFDIQESTTFTLSFAEDMLATSALHEPQEMKLLLIEGYEGFALDDEFLANLLTKTTYETLTSGDTAALTLLGAGIDMQTSENGGFYVQNAAYLIEDNNLYWTGTVTTVPEPTTATLSLLALAALAARRRRK